VKREIESIIEMRIGLKDELAMPASIAQGVCRLTAHPESHVGGATPGGANARGGPSTGVLDFGPGR
jgi:hypothetical protein